MIRDKLSTKQFADLCKVEKRTLFYYDEIDLLKPVEVSENGYRIYSSDQFETMSIIKALQSVGMSLSDIKALMNEQDISHCRIVLENQIFLIHEKQEELRAVEQILSTTMEQLEDYLRYGRDKFFIEEIEDIYLITQEISEEKTKVINYLTNGYHLGVIMYENAPTVPQYVFKKAPSRKEANTVKFAGTYAWIYQSVENGKIVEAILAFLDYLKMSHLSTEGPLYVNDLASDFIRFPNQEFIFKLSIKLRR